VKALFSILFSSKIGFSLKKVKPGRRGYLNGIDWHIKKSPSLNSTVSILWISNLGDNILRLYPGD